MKRRFLLSVFLFLGILISHFFLFKVWQAEAAKPVRIGILFDGPYWNYKKQISSIQRSLKTLSSGLYDIQFPQNIILNGEYDLKKIQLYADELTSKHKPGIILTFGVESAKAFSKKKSLSIPVISKEVFFPVELGLLQPKTYKPINPNWTTSYDPTSDETILALISKLTPAKEITVICSSFICNNNPKIIKIIKKFQFKSGIQFQTLIIDPKNYLRQLSKLKTSLVFVPELYGFNENQSKKLFQKLIELQIPSYTLDGLYGIENGALVAIDFRNPEKFGRSYALKILDILDGKNPKDIPVIDYWKGRLIFNRETVQKIGYDIPLDYFYEATLYGKKTKQKKLTLREAQKTAMNQNYNIKIQALIENQAMLGVQIAERQFFPRINSGLNYSRIDDTRADVAPQNRRETKFEFKLQQQL